MTGTQKHIVGEARVNLREELEGKFTEGDTIRALAEEFGRSYGLVRTLPMEAGVPLRRPGGFARKQATEENQ